MKKYYLFISIVLLAALLFCFSRYCFKCNSYNSLIALTLLAILWYSYETLLLRQETAKQTELQIRPYLYFKQGHWPVDNKDHFHINVVNVGKGIAFNLKTHKVTHAGGGEVNSNEIKVYPENIIFPFEYKDEQPILIKSDNLPPFLPIIIYFTYTDIENREYKANVKIYPNNTVELLEQERISTG